MNGLNNSTDDVVECPLCMEPLEVDDLNFFPCTCGYQICRFCWHRIRTDENELCPACRKEYPENPADFTPLTQEEMIAFKSQKRQRDQQRKHKITENRKHLANVRVVQKNLVFVVGLPPRLADADILKKHEYFGKYGKIHKVVINPSTTYAGVQGPSASAYVTYVQNSDALRAIQSVNNIMIDGRLIKTSLGTTKYCSHFMKNQQCPKGDCMYLHELGDPEASFTKEEMHQGKHQEYEKRLHDALIATSGLSLASGMGQISSNGNTSGNTQQSKNIDNKTVNCNASVASSSVSSTTSLSMSSSLSSTSSSSSTTTNGPITVTASSIGAAQKDAWPCLSVSPVNNKETAGGSNGNGKSRREKAKHDKTKNDKNGKPKNKHNNYNFNHTSSCSSSSNEINQHLQSTGLKDTLLSAIESSAVAPILDNNSSTSNNNRKSKSERNKDKSHHDKLTNRNKDQSYRPQKEIPAITADEEVKFIEDYEKQNHRTSSKGSQKNSNSENSLENEDQRSLSSSSNVSSSSSSGSDGTSSTLSESTSGKSSPVSSTENSITHIKNGKQPASGRANIESNVSSERSKVEQILSDVADGSNNDEVSKITELHNSNDADETMVKGSGVPSPSCSTTELHSSNNICNQNIIDTTAALSKLNIFDDNNSFFSSSASTSFQQSLLLKNKIAVEMRQNQMNNVITSHLPDLLNGIDGYQSNTAHSNDWEEAFKSVIMRNNKQMEEQFQQQHLHQQQLQHQQQQLLQHEEFLRIQEIQKRSGLLNNVGLSQINGPHSEFPNNFHGSADLNRLSQVALMQQQQQQQQLLQHQHSPHISEHELGNSNLFGTNMSKFFDFHKNQQQQMHQQFLINGHVGGNEHLRMASLLENNRINAQFLDQPNGLLTPPPQQQQQQPLQKQRLLGKYDSMLAQQQVQTQQQQGAQQQQQQQQQPAQTRLPKQFSQKASVDDDLGFDPFIETQKALAELMEHEVVQQQTTCPPNTNNSTGVGAKMLQPPQQQHQGLDNMQRARMPPPGFNHMNAFGFGVPHGQNNSKILPFVNVAGSETTANGQTLQHQQMQMSNNWNPHVAAFQQQMGGDTQLHQVNPTQNNGNNNKGYSNTDWTVMDPAILSFRQFSSFSQQPQIPHHPQQQDMFMQHLAQQQQQQPNAQSFGSQPPQLNAAINLPNNAVLNPQQPNQAQVNFLPSNWLNTEQSLFMNSIANGFTNNNFDKYAIPMPPGIYPNNLNKPQKAECIN